MAEAESAVEGKKSKRVEGKGSSRGSSRGSSLPWKGRGRLTILVLVFFVLLGLLTARLFSLSGAETAEEFRDSMERMRPVYPLDK